VQHAAFSNSLPPNRLSITDSFSIEGRPWPREQQAPIGPVLFVSPDYFETIGIPLQRGRNFNAADRIDSPQVTLISESMAKRYFPNEDPIGKRIKVGGAERPNAPWMEIVGIVGDARYGRLDAPVEPTRYQTLAQVPWIGVYLVVKTSGDPLQVVPAIKSELAKLDSDVPLARIRTMDQIMDQAVGQPRFRAFLLALFAALALVLAAVGIYGVMSYSVSRRARELGIRVSLGAGRGEVLRMLLREGFLLSLSGVALGMVGAMAVTRYISGLLFEVTATDPFTYVIVSTFLLSVALVACYLPANRATRADPLIVLKGDS
jgi:putative ABC transport system permease protein